MRDVANRFGVRGAVNKRPVPHITLFGPHNTDEGPRAKEIVEDVCSQYDVVPYRLDGFGHFRNDVLYVDVVPSPDLRRLRRELSKRLRPISYNYPRRDRHKYHSFHITVAFRDIENQFDRIWRYVNREYSPDIDEYATRITSLRNRDMMHEYDLLRDKSLSPDEATSADSWKRTGKSLHDQTSPDDHDRCSRLGGLSRLRH